MTRRTIDIDGTLWRELKIDAARQGITLKQLVTFRLSQPNIPPLPLPSETLAALTSRRVPSETLAALASRRVSVDAIDKKGTR